MGNTVGSLELPRILTTRKRMTLKLSEFQRAVLTGCILGDAYITKLGKVRIEQSAKQEAYVFWKHKVLAEVVYAAQPRLLVRWHTKQGKHYASYRFSTRQYFQLWRDALYPQGTKIFPQSFLLTPASLAVWYMDDGCWTGTKAVIAIEGFDDVSQQHIKAAPHDQFQIETVIGKNRKLVVRKKSHEVFFDLISRYVIPSMRYKIPNPVTT